MSKKCQTTTNEKEPLYIVITIKQKILVYYTMVIVNCFYFTT